MTGWGGRELVSKAATSLKKSWVGYSRTSPPPPPPVPAHKKYGVSKAPQKPESILDSVAYGWGAII